MKKQFAEYYELPEERIKEIWENSLIVFDTNVLLNLYRYNEDARTEFINVIKFYKERLWIPYQVGLEFHRLRSDIIKGQDLSFIKTLGIGGEGVTPEFEIKANKFMSDHNIKSTMMYGYGMTENASGATSRFNQETSSPGAVGVPQVNTIVSIFDPETNEEKLYGEEGEICILSSSIMLGYYKNPEMTEKALRLHSDGNLWLHSGDVGYMDENGHLFVKGRIKRMMMLFSGNKLYPADIEELIETIDEVERAVIVPEPDPIHDGAIVPCAFITLNAPIPEQELRFKIKEVLGEKMVSYVNLNNIYIKEELPHTSIGKVDLQKLEKESYTLAKRNK